MVRRIDYLNDPNAPEANSLVPSVNSVVVDHDGAVLLIRRTDNGNWSLPGGAINLGESLKQAAVRETLEETGVLTEVTGLLGIYTNPHHLVEYTSDGEVRQEFTIVLHARVLSGYPTPSSESSQVEWVSPQQLDTLSLHPSMQERIDHFVNGDATPHID